MTLWNDRSRLLGLDVSASTIEGVDERVGARRVRKELDPHAVFELYPDDFPSSADVGKGGRRDPGPGDTAEQHRISKTVSGGAPDQ